MKIPFLNLKDQYAEIKSEIEPLISDIIDNCCFIGGKYVSEFEKNMEDYLGIKYVVGCGNGTDALALALKACGVKYGDEVITSPFTFFATAEAIASVGAIPVFVDINEADYNINVDKIEEAITDKTKAILPVHIFGAPCDMDKIMEIARRHNLKVIEDDAQAIGSEYKGRKAGTLGDVGCFSFYPTKNLGGAGDGGMVTTNDDGLYTILKAYREHGSGKNGAEASNLLGEAPETIEMTQEATDLYDPYKYYNYLIGYNSRLDAIQAAILNVKLKHLDEYNEKRAKIAEKYCKGLDKRYQLPKYEDNIKSCWHQFVLKTDYKEELCSYLSEHGVGNGMFYPVPLHKQKAFNEKNSRVSGTELSVADKTTTQTVCLPIFPEMTDEQVEYVIDRVNSFIKKISIN